MPQGGEYPIEKSLVLFPAEEPKFFIFLCTHLIQLGEKCNVRLNIVIEVDEAESH